MPAKDVSPGTYGGRASWGAIYLADQKIPMKVPRVRDRLRGQEVLLQTYERLQQPRALDTGLLHKGLGGLATREYARCAEAVPEAFGLSASTVSRRFKRASARKLQEVSERRLDGYDLVALILDEKTFAEDEIVAAVGVAVTGEKVLLRIHSWRAWRTVRPESTTGATASRSTAGWRRRFSISNRGCGASRAFGHCRCCVKH